MGRILNYVYEDDDSITVDTAASCVNLKEPAGFLGVFGGGYFKTFYSNGVFKVPQNVTQIRVRVVGSGGYGSINGTAGGATGGAGGGYAHGVFNVNPGEEYNVVIGTCGTLQAPLKFATTTSFGNLLSASGGQAGVASDVPTIPLPGKGFGGDFQASGGSSTPRGGGGAAGSQLGDGGWGMTKSADSMSSGAGGSVGGNHSYFTAGSSPFGQSSLVFCGPDIYGDTYLNSLNLISSSISQGNFNVVYRKFKNKLDIKLRFPFDGFIDSGGGSYISQYTEISIPGLSNHTCKLHETLYGGGGGALAISTKNTDYTVTAMLSCYLVGGGGGRLYMNANRLDAEAVLIGGGSGAIYLQNAPTINGQIKCQGLIVVEW